MKNTTKEKYEEIFDYLSYILCFFVEGRVRAIGRVFSFSRT